MMPFFCSFYSDNLSELFSWMRHLDGIVFNNTGQFWHKYWVFDMAPGLLMHITRALLLYGVCDKMHRLKIIIRQLLGAVQDRRRNDFGIEV